MRGNKKLDFTKRTWREKTVQLPASKSESNRWLILSHLYPGIEIQHLSPSGDTRVMMQALSDSSATKHLGGAGTAMRFLTAYYSLRRGDKNEAVTLTGDAHLLNRPISGLVDALRSLGADIRYAQKENFPPLVIRPQKIHGGTVSIDPGISSQYISALLMIAPALEQGLDLRFTRKPVSYPYIEMTLRMLKMLGVRIDTTQEYIRIHSGTDFTHIKVSPEPDWSALSYYYTTLSFLPEAGCFFPGFKRDSLQGDRMLANLYQNFGLETRFEDHGIHIGKIKDFVPKRHIQLDLNACPDLAQSIAVTCLGLGISCGLKGLETLKIKETDRLTALKNELKKTGTKVRITDSSIHISPPERLIPGIEIETYNDHRMAMAFAPLSVLIPISIRHPEVVSKSYPDFWRDWESVFK